MVKFYADGFPHNSCNSYYHKMYTVILTVCVFPWPVSLGLLAVNQAVEEGKTSQTLRVLRLPDVALRSVVEECAGVYQAEITTLLLSQICGRSVPTTVIHLCSCWL
jgi:hypothetical protein